MKNFNKIKYISPNYEECKSTIKTLINKLKDAANTQEFITLTKDTIKIQTHIEEMHDYADISNIRDMENEFWSNEMSF